MLMGLEECIAIIEERAMDVRLTRPAQLVKVSIENCRTHLYIAFFAMQDFGLISAHVTLANEALSTSQNGAAEYLENLKSHLEMQNHYVPIEGPKIMDDSIFVRVPDPQLDKYITSPGYQAVISIIA